MNHGITTDRLAKMHATAEQARQAADDATAAFHAAVAQAMAEGVPAVAIAEACGVTRQRPYQWRSLATR